MMNVMENLTAGFRLYTLYLYTVIDAQTTSAGAQVNYKPNLQLL